MWGVSNKHTPACPPPITPSLPQAHTQRKQTMSPVLSCPCPVPHPPPSSHPIVPPAVTALPPRPATQGRHEECFHHTHGGSSSQPALPSSHSSSSSFQVRRRQAWHHHSLAEGGGKGGIAPSFRVSQCLSQSLGQVSSEVVVCVQQRVPGPPFV